MRTCSKCGVTKKLSDFYRHPKGRDGYFGHCADCERKRAREKMRRLRDADPNYAVTARNAHLWHRYRVSPKRFADILASQEGGCAVCGTVSPGGKGAFHVDHDHDCCPGDQSCGKCVRGLLCHGCNIGIGAFGEDVDRLMAAAAYLLARQNVLGSVKT